MSTSMAFDGDSSQLPAGQDALSAGEVRFTTADERRRVCDELAADGLIVARVRTLEPAARGRFQEVIEEAVEQALLARGAAAPGISAHFGFDSELGDDDAILEADLALRDQLFRARKVGARGLCVALGPLGPAGSAWGTLEPQDGAMLRFLARATRERPLVVLLDRDDEGLSAYTDPIPLALLLSGARRSETRPGKPTATAALDHPRCDEAPVSGTHAAAPPVDSSPSVAALPEREPSRPAPSAPSVNPAAVLTEPAPPPSANREFSDEWRAWVTQIHAARGPQPLAAFERLFTQSYMPLTCAIEHGLDEPRALTVHDDFRRTFSKSYSDACATFAMTHKRPRLVMDVHETAGRIARLHGARTTQLLLVDGLRWDLGGMMKERLVGYLASRAALTDELLLWSALPSTTWRQLETIARGVDALRTPAETDGEPEPLRARTAEFIRRIKVGGRDVHKLDLVQVRVGEAGAGVRDLLPALADEVAEVVAQFAESLPSRTLLMVFGDHGFTLDRRGVAQHGGGSPEEVLVPAYAFLVGEVH